MTENWLDSLAQTRCHICIIYDVRVTVPQNYSPSACLLALCLAVRSVLPVPCNRYHCHILYRQIKFPAFLISNDKMCPQRMSCSFCRTPSLSKETVLIIMQQYDCQHIYHSEFERDSVFMVEVLYSTPAWYYISFHTLVSFHVFNAPDKKINERAIMQPGMNKNCLLIP